MRGDSAAMLCWTESGRFRGTQVTAAACVYTLMAVNFEVEYVEAQHLQGVRNVRSDSISRKVPKEFLLDMYPELVGIEHWPADESTRKLILLCDPRHVAVDDKMFILQWRSILELLRD